MKKWSLRQKKHLVGNEEIDRRGETGDAHNGEELGPMHAEETVRFKRSF